MVLARTTKAIIFLTLLSAFGAARAEADMIAWGIPVAGASSSTPVGIYGQTIDATPDGKNNATSNWIKYYIPLGGPGSTYGNTSGTYGVTNVPGGKAGTFADTGNGYNASLDMFLRFAPVAPQPIASARLDFDFSDLDLTGVNDPVGFLESVQFFSGTTPLAPLFVGTTTGAGSTGVSGSEIYWQLTRTSGSAGKNWPVYIDFWGSGLNSLVKDTYFSTQLHFSVPSRIVGTNTPEYLRASLTTSSAPIVLPPAPIVPPPAPIVPPPATTVPEPGSLLLLGTGLFGLVAARSRRQQA